MAAPEPNHAAKKERNWPHHLQRLPLIVSIIACVALFLCYRFQPDVCAALTLVPAWIWLAPALLCAAYGFARRQSRLAFVSLALWMVYAVMTVEESQSLIRAGVQTVFGSGDAQPERVVRVISLNCFGQASAAFEVVEHRPDVVLFQESPSQEALRRLANELYGEKGAVLWSTDSSIICSGSLQTIANDEGACFVLARATLPNGVECDIASLRLLEPAFRTDLWSPGCWSEHRKNRLKRRQQVLELKDALTDHSNGHPLIFGGDFNCTRADASLWPLREIAADSFRIAGTGWGNTGENKVPLWRVDQIWASPQFKPIRVTAHRTKNSDHRMVICDLRIAQ